MISKYKSFIAELLIQQVVNNHHAINIRGRNGRFILNIERIVRCWGRVSERVQIKLSVTDTHSGSVREYYENQAETPAKHSKTLESKCLKAELYTALCLTDGLLFPI